MRDKTGTIALNAHNGASKRFKSKSRVVGRGKQKNALERTLRANLKKACLSAGASLKTVNHPYLDGILCREDGAVFLPGSGVHKGHWTYGVARCDGYCGVVFDSRFHYVHRLVCESFHGLCSEDKPEVDHINRDKSDNRPENLRWADRSENTRNSRNHDRVALRGSPHSYEDAEGYRHAYYLTRKDTPAHKEIDKAARKRYRKTHKAVIFSDHKPHFVPNAEAATLLKLPVKERIWAPKSKNDVPLS